MTNSRLFEQNLAKKLSPNDSLRKINDGDSPALTLSNVDDLLIAEINKLSETDEQFWTVPNRDPRDSGHAFFQYPAMMVPAVQRNLIHLVTEIQAGINYMVDPFVGAGTTLTSGMHNGLNCYGQDINPLAVLLSLTKTGPFNYEVLTEEVKEIKVTIEQDHSDEIAVDFPNRAKWFRQDVAVELSRLKRAIEQRKDLMVRRFMWVTLAEVVRLTSNDRTSTYKLHARPADEITSRALSPITTFFSLINQNLEDFKQFQKTLTQAGYLQNGRFTRDVQVFLGDTQEGVLRPTKVPQYLYDLLVSSPPYGDNTSTIPYGQHAYLPLQWINLEDIDPAANTSFLRTTQEIDHRSLGGHLSRSLDEQIETLGEESAILANVFQALANKPRDRSSRIAAFYQDFIGSLEHIVNSLAVNAYMIWTIGNRRVGGIEIPNHRILCELLERRNVKFVTHIERQILFKRMPHKNQIAKMMHKERILILRKTAHMREAQ